jgi:hypothetical protein
MTKKVQYTCHLNNAHLSRTFSYANISLRYATHFIIAFWSETGHILVACFRLRKSYFKPVIFDCVGITHHFLKVISLTKSKIPSLGRVCFACRIVKDPLVCNEISQFVNVCCSCGVTFVHKYKTETVTWHFRIQLTSPFAYPRQ